jgi:hypothetical protein
MPIREQKDQRQNTKANGHGDAHLANSNMGQSEAGKDKIERQSLCGWDLVFSKYYGLWRLV